ncbi:MAG: hypothetical protein M1837_006811 [Sclerophora amabilis]|nr:MAG: hypothetical protein M1837_006811 [Sclerophora amabilis]
MTSAPSLRIFLDFDSTLTVHDTIGALSSLAPAPPPPPPHHQSAQGIPSAPDVPFSTFTDSYLADLAAHKQSYHGPPADDARASSALAAETAYLASLRPIEEASLARLEAAGWFRGWTTSAVADGARTAVAKGDVVLRPGWLDLKRDVQRLQRMGEAGGGGAGTEAGGVLMVIVSVNWSRTWVRQCINAAGKAALTTATGAGAGIRAGSKRRIDVGKKEAEGRGRQGRGESSVDVSDGIQIIANEIEGLDMPDGSSGKIIGCGTLQGERVLVSADKKRILDTFKNQSPPGDARCTTVYVGDSMTDFECLLDVDVDVGIVIRDEEVRAGQRELAEALDRVRVTVRWIGEYDPDDAEGVGRRVWWARDFEEIRRALLTRSEGIGWD